MKASLRNAMIGGFAGLLLVAAASAQSVQVAKIEKPQFDDLPSPDLNVGKGKNFRPKNWLEIVSPITVPAQNAEQKKSGFIDQVVVKWYVAVKNKDAAGTYWLLNKEITHLNVPVDQAINTSVYLSPNTLQRLTGSDRAGKQSVESVGVEIFINGTKVGQESSKGNPGWWAATSNKMAATDKFPLLNKNETPFKMLWWDAYAEIDEKK